MSMLGRLLNTAASSLNPATYTSRTSAPLESVTEEEHTSGLLFPDANLLRRSNTHAYPLQTSAPAQNAAVAGSFDDRGGLELDATRDLRVIIAQNALGDRDEPCILLDTQSLCDSEDVIGPGFDPRLSERPQSRRSRSSTLSKGSRRNTTIGSQFTLPDVKPFPGASHPREQELSNTSALFLARSRNPTLSSAPGDCEYHQNRMTADSNELSLLRCIFGSSAFSYRSSSTKMHVLPVEREPRDVQNSGPRGPQHRAPLSRAHTAGSQSISSALFHERLIYTNDLRLQPPTKFTVLITRMFSVNLPEGVNPSADSPEPHSSHPEIFRDPDLPFSDPGKRKKIKEKKTPMYAVAITVKLPLPARSSGRPTSRWSTQGSDPLKPPGWMSFSLDDPRWSGAFLDDNLSFLTPLSHLDDRIDILVDHWFVITRTLSHLERLARKEILALLKKADYCSAQQPKPAKLPNMQRTNQTIVQLSPNVLTGRSDLREEAFRATQRICLALRIPRVVTGQSRWGVWREEARWIARCLSDKEHNFFFLVLITAFLGNHTEWLSLLGPDWYRRRHHLQQKAHQDAERIISNRTVIISADKMTARRLIFVLSAFLPLQQRPDMVGSPLRPGTSASLRPLSQSPPSAPILRQESLRRTINRRARARLNTDEHGKHKRSASASPNEAAAQLLDEIEFAKIVDHHKTRRDSDARSIRTSSLRIASNDVSTRKASAATIATATPGTATPVPHFTSQRSNQGVDPSARLSFESSGSAASQNLLQTLIRSDSSSINTEAGGAPPLSRWGSLISGFWGSRDTSSNGKSEISASANVSKTQSMLPKTETQERSPRKLNDMVSEAKDVSPNDRRSSDNTSVIASSVHHPSTPELVDMSDPNLTTESHVPSSPVKLSVRPGDGVVDVDVPLPGFVSLSSSGDSTAASPKKTRTSITSLDGVGSIQSGGSGFCNVYKDYDGVNVNVSGWLRRYHEDFLLQAVHPYSELEADIKRSMSAESTPIHVASTPASDDGPDPEKWVDICTTLVADARTFTVKRLRLRRRIPVEGSETTVPSPPNSLPITPYGPSEMPSSTSQFSGFFSSVKTLSSIMADTAETVDMEETFVEEPVMDLDATLVDAVERVLACSGQSSLIQSRASSPNRSRRGRQAASQPGDKQTADLSHDDVVSVEVPRNECRKMVLGALEEVVRSVTAEHGREDACLPLGIDSTESLGQRRKTRTSIADNTLREGIRKWLLDIEEAC